MFQKKIFHVFVCVTLAGVLAACSQASLLRRAEEAYDAAGPFPNSDVTIDATGGVVTVKGTVGSQQDRNEIDIVMRDAVGRESFVNELKVVRAAEMYRDQQLVVSPLAVEAFKKVQKLRPEGLYQFRVRQISKSGLLLEGEVESVTVRRQVEQAVLSTRGVSNVENNMTMRQYPSGTELYELVREKLVSNRPALALENAQIRVDGSKVIVDGAFPDHEALDHVLSVIASVEGVSEVENRSHFQDSGDTTGLY